jgi:hypothetical protein
VLHPRGHRGAQQRLARDRVVAIIIERLLDALRHHDRAGEVHDRADSLLVDHAVDQHPLGDRSVIESDALRNDVARSGRQVIDHHDRPARVPQREHRVAADIPGAAGNEDWKLAHGICR